MKQLSLFAIVLLLFSVTAFGQSNMNPALMPYLANAGKFARQEKYAEAIDEMSRAIAVEPNNVRLYFWRAQYFADSKNIKAALDDIRYGVDLEPNNISTLNLATYTYALIDQFPEAVKTADRVVESFPDNPTAYLNRATIRLKIEDFTGAIEDYVRCFEVMPSDNQNTMQVIVRLINERIIRDDEAARSYERLAAVTTRRVEFADAKLAEYLRNNPDELKNQRNYEWKLEFALSEYLSMLDTLKKSYASQNMPDKATETVERIARFETQILNLKNCPSYCLELRADYYQNRGKYRQALAEIDRTMSGLSKKTTYRYIKRGELYVLTEQYERAIWDYEKAIILDPNLEFTLSEKIDSAKQKLEEKKLK